MRRRTAGVDKGDVVSGGAFANPPWREAHAALLQPGDGASKVIDPQSNVVERGLVNTGTRLHVDGDHQVQLDPGQTGAEHGDIFVDVLALAAVVALDFNAEQLDPQPAHRRLVGAADRDLLKSQNTEGSSIGHEAAL